MLIPCPWWSLSDEYFVPKLFASPLYVYYSANQVIFNQHLEIGLYMASASYRHVGFSNLVMHFNSTFIYLVFRACDTKANAK